jgi:hypothetical protein
MAHLCVEICSLFFPKSVTAAGFVVYQAHIDTPPNKGDRPTLNRSRLASEERIQRLRLISSKVPSEENIVVCKGTCQYQKKGGKRKKWSFHGTTLVILANPGRSTRCFIPTRSSTCSAPMPERSKIPGEPNVPAETRTSFVPRTVRVSFGPSGYNSGLRVYATPVARFSL